MTQTTQNKKERMCVENMKKTVLVAIWFILFKSLFFRCFKSLSHTKRGNIPFLSDSLSSGHFMNTFVFRFYYQIVFVVVNIVTSTWFQSFDGTEHWRTLSILIICFIHSQLKSTYPFINLPPFPRRTIFRPTLEESMQRRITLQKFFDEILSRPVINTDPILLSLISDEESSITNDDNNNENEDDESVDVL
jgi:hypothetical protein